jgi:DNA-binding winged helix-turn-helix (wHTH) protein
MPLQADRYRFGPYEIRTHTRELYKHGTRLKLRPQPFRVLQVLVEHAGDVVTRDDLRQALWPAETFVDFEHGLNASIRDLRRVLNDSPGQPRYIETMPKLGYRMLAAVEAEAAREIPPAAEARPVEDPRPVSTRPHRHLLRLTRAAWIYGGLAALLVALPAAWIVVNRHPGPESSMPVPLTSFPGHAQAATWSPDGRQVAFKWTGEKQNQFDIYVLQPGSSHALRLTTEAIANINPAWSPDGRWIAYVHIESRSGRSSLELVSPLGGPIRTVLTSETPM